MSKLNPTGIKPVEYKVLVKPSAVDEKEGVLWLPETTVARLQETRDQGVLVEASEMAFSDWKGHIPKIGDKVVFSKYAGSVCQDPVTREKYRLMNDKDICAVMEEPDNGTGITSKND